MIGVNKSSSFFTLLRSKIPNWVIHLISIPVTILLCFVAIEYVNIIEHYDLEYFLQHLTPENLLLSCVTIGILWSVVFVLGNRIWLANLLCGCICGGIAFVNHYVIQFHGMPLSFLVLRNFTTAMNVIHSYTLTLDFHAKCVLLLTASLILFSLAVKQLSKPVKKPLRKVLLRDSILILLCIVAFYVCYLGETPIKPRQTIGWVWTEPYTKYGYTACTVETLFQSISVVNEP